MFNKLNLIRNLLLSKGSEDIPEYTEEQLAFSINEYLDLIEYQLIKYKNVNHTIEGFIEDLYLEEILSNKVKLSILSLENELMLKRLLNIIYTTYHKLPECNSYAVDNDLFYSSLFTQISSSEILEIIYHVRSELNQ